MRQKRGGTLVTTLFLALTLAMLVGTTASLVTSNYSLAWSKSNSESALLLAEAGANWEMQYISKQLQNGVSANAAHAPVALSGQPFPGQPGTIAGVPGRFWVYATKPGTATPYDGFGPAQITCTAIVGNGVTASSTPSNWGRVVKRTVTVQTVPQSIFDRYALFALDSSSTSSMPALGVTGNAVVRINGPAGTNGRIQTGSGVATFTEAHNFNTAAMSTGTQFTGSNVRQYPQPFVLPTVTEVLQNSFDNIDRQDPWGWIARRNDNDNVLQYAPLLGSLSNTGTIRAGFKRTQMIFTNSDVGGWRADLVLAGSLGLFGTLGKQGSWTGINFRPGSLSVRTLIFPPGDYYFSDIDVKFDENTEIVIDNAGLTTPQGSNPDGIPVRFWINGTGQQDYLGARIVMTDKTDPSTFRVFYNKDGCTLNFVRASNAPSGELTVAGAIYAVTNRLDPSTGLPVNSGLKGTNIDFTGDTSDPNKKFSILGSLVADRIQFNGQCDVLAAAVVVGQRQDPAAGVGFVTNCTVQPCYSAEGQ